MRAILDVNVLVSALIAPRGACAQLVAEWESGLFEIVACDELIAELERVCGYAKLAAIVRREDLDELVDAIRNSAVMASVTRPPPVRASDPGDDYLLALASEQGAPLVTGDGHLLALAAEAPIYSPREFLELLDRS